MNTAQQPTASTAIARAANPLITLSLPFTRGNRLLLTVHNHGATADFFAKLRVDGLLRSYPEGEIFCRWNHTDHHVTEIPEGVPFDLFLAVLRAPELKGRWCVQYVTGSDVPGEVEHQRTFYPGTPVPIGPVRVDDLPRIAAETMMTAREFLQGELAKPDIPDAYRKSCERELARLDLLPEEVTAKKSVAEAIVTLSVDIFAKPQIIDSKTHMGIRLRGPGFEVLPEITTPVQAGQGEAYREREQVRVRAVMKELTPGQWRILARLAHEGPTSLPFGVDLVLLSNARLIESIGPGLGDPTGMGIDLVWRIHPDARDAVIEAIANERHLR